MKPDIALQLYTVRQLIAAEGFDSVVKQVAAIGYRGVEPAGFPGTTAAAAAKLFQDLKLRVPSAHFPLPLGDQKNQVLDDARTIGCTRLVSGKGPDDFKTPDLIKQTCDVFNQASAVARENGLAFAIHNHWWEFENVEGRPIYQHMLEHLDAAVLFELDVYWIQTAGADPAAVVRQIGKRAPLLHIKDGPCQRGQPMTAVGQGKVDIQSVAKASHNTAEWFIVELDECATDMLTAVKQSFAYITKAGLVNG